MFRAYYKDMPNPTRRNFLRSAAVVPLAAAAAPAATAPDAPPPPAHPADAPPPAAPAPARLPIRKAVEFGMLPNAMGVLERFQLAKEVGFEEIECPTTPEQAKAEEMLAASKKVGLPIHSVMNQEHWRSPLSSPDPAVVEKSLEGMRASLRNAKLWGAGTVLLVPAVVTADVGYAAAWERSQREIRKLLPLAAETKVVIGIENVWNKFLLSPIEFGRYVDEFKSPWVKAYFDIGNVAIQSFPQDWIRILNKRIVKLHFKDFAFRKRVAEFTPLLEGDIDWKAVHASIAEIGYKGSATVELPGGDAAYLKEVHNRFERILSGA
jgi:L-ribulose-5-phosphate 3-epimerase